MDSIIHLYVFQETRKLTKTTSQLPIFYTPTLQSGVKHPEFVRRKVGRIASSVKSLNNV